VCDRIVLTRFLHAPARLKSAGMLRPKTLPRGKMGRTASAAFSPQASGLSAKAGWPAFAPQAPKIK
jgi:hypothetical protein